MFKVCMINGLQRFWVKKCAGTPLLVDSIRLQDTHTDENENYFHKNRLRCLAVCGTSISNDLVGMARESVLAHLMKLETERRASREGARWAVVA